MFCFFRECLISHVFFFCCFAEADPDALLGSPKLLVHLPLTGLKWLRRLMATSPGWNKQQVTHIWGDQRIEMDGNVG